MKITQFFAMALAALAIVSCAKQDVGIENGPDGEEINSPTYAMFKFNIGGGTKAAFDPTTTSPKDADDKKIGAIQLLIFNATTQALEFNEVVTGATSKTVLLTAGRKKIFFIANNEKLTEYNAAIDPASFLPGTGTLAVFNTQSFRAGTPQKLNASGARTFDFSNLYTVGSSASGLPMSNTNEITYTLAAGISETAASGGSGVTTGVSATNTFNVQLYYMTAKANLKLASGVLNTADGKPVIKNVSFSIRNLANKTNYVQNVPTAGNPQSAYFNFKGTTQVSFDGDFDYASNISVPLNETASQYLYVPENNNSLLQRGQSSYFAIKATYEPVVKTAVVYDVNSTVVYTEAKLASAGGSRNYIYTTADVEGISAGTYFLTKELFAQDAWIRKNGKAYVEVSHKAEAEALIVAAGKPYLSYTDATSYYRVDIGDGTGADTQYGVLRSNKYEATINKITGPGVPTEGDLIIDPENPVSAKTYIQATIVPAVWTPITQTADL